MMICSTATYLLKDLLFAFVVPARAHHEVEVPFVRAILTLFSLNRAETGIDAALVAEPPPKEPPDALHVTVEVPATRHNLALDGKWRVLGSRRRELRGGPVRPCSRKIHVPFRVLVRRAHHLREVDNNRLPCNPVDKNIKLIKVSMNQP